MHSTRWVYIFLALKLRTSNSSWYIFLSTGRLCYNISLKIAHRSDDYASRDIYHDHELEVYILWEQTMIWGVHVDLFDLELNRVDIDF
jgi:hypothetical protein